MSNSITISRGQTLLVLVAALVAAQSALFFSDRTLLPIAPSVTTTAGVPFGYTGPVSNGPSAIDPAGSLNVSYLFDVYSVAAFKDGTIPFWNPYQGLGQPQLANGLSAALYPLNLLLFLIPHYWWDVAYLINWLLAAFFVTEYLRVIGCRGEGMLVGGVAVLGSGFFQYYLPMREVVAVAAWFPLLLYALERAARDKHWQHRHWVFALATVCCLTAGQPESSFIALSLSGVYALVTMAALGADRWRFALACLPGTFAGLLLSSPFWLTFSDYAFKAFSNHPAGGPMSQIALDWRTAASYVFPLLFGRIHAVPYGIPVPGWVWDHSPGWMPVAVGFLALIGIGVAIRERQRAAVLTGGMGLLIVAKIWGIPGAAILSSLPLFDRIVYPRYAAFVTAICAAILAGIGFDRLHFMDRRRAVRVAALWIVILLGLYAAARVWSLPIFESREVRLYSILGLAWAVASPLGILLVKWRGNEAPLAVATCTAILLQLAAYMPGYSSAEYLGLGAGALGFWCLGVMAIAVRRQQVSSWTALTVAISGIASMGFFAPRLAHSGLPRRYDVLTMAPYLQELQWRQGLGERVYALDGNPQPNFGAALRVPSVNTLEVLAPPETAGFISSYLDRSVDPLWLSGTMGGSRRGSGTALSELAANERYFDLIGVRYLTSTRSSPLPAVYDTGHTVSAAPVARPLASPLESWFVTPVSTLPSVEVYLSTYGRFNPGAVRLTVLNADRRVIAESTIPGEHVTDNSYATFHFSSLQLGIGDRVGLRLSYEPLALGAMLAAWEYPSDAAAAFVFRVPGENKRLRKILTDPRTGVTIWERLGAFPRAFLATSARVVADSRSALGLVSGLRDLRREVLIDVGSEIQDDQRISDPGELKELQLKPNRVLIRYQAQAAGILTLTDSYAPGWTATVNGHISEIARVDGVFRGVRIPGPGEYVVEYVYRPPTWALSCGAAAAGLALLGTLSVRRVRG